MAHRADYPLYGGDRMQVTVTESVNQIPDEFTKGLRVDVVHSREEMEAAIEGLGLSRAWRVYVGRRRFRGLFFVLSWRNGDRAAKDAAIFDVDLLEKLDHAHVSYYNVMARFVLFDDEGHYDARASRSAEMGFRKVLADSPRAAAGEYRKMYTRRVYGE